MVAESSGAEEYKGDPPMQAEGVSEDIFIESVLELRHTDAILLVFSDGKAWSLFENIQCEMVARPASLSIFKNLVGGQLI